MKVKVSELEGRALNYAVAYVEHGQPRPAGNWHCFDTGNQDEPQVIVRELPKAIQDDEYNPSGNWAHGGPLIEASGCNVGVDIAGVWYCSDNDVVCTEGATVLEALCRGYVYQYIGPVIEIPDELMEASHA